MEKLQPPRATADVPLARDPDGNRILLPETAFGWRIRRQTGGRPRLVLDSSKQPMVFPLQYTAADAEDILPPGNYRLDVIDKDGTPLDVTVPLSIHAHRNADPSEPEVTNEIGAAAVVSTLLPGPASDVRLVLEANVRATQMAFLHNHRTLETSLRMAETLRDSIHVLATSQADWIKSLAAQRGLFRNAPAQPLLPAPPQRSENEHDDDDDDDEDEDQDQDDAADHPKTWPDVLTPFAQHIAPIVPMLIAQRSDSASAPSTVAASASPDAGGRSGTSVADDAELATKGWELRDLVDLNYVARKAKARKAAQQSREHASPPSNEPPAASPGQRARSLHERVLSDPELMQRLMAVNAQLTPAESALLQELSKVLSIDERERLFEQVKGMTVEEGVRWLREMLGNPRAATDAERSGSSTAS